MREVAVFIEPSSKHYLNDRLFDLSNPILNRDDTLLPFARLKSALNRCNIAVHTGDMLRNGKVLARNSYYYSLGMYSGCNELSLLPNVKMCGFFLLEPPLVAPEAYKALPKLCRVFETIYLHNIVGHQYSLQGVNPHRIKKLYFPQPYEGELEPYWGNSNRSNKLVVIAGNHKPKKNMDEYYSLRINAISQLSAINAVDLFGRGWDKWWSRHSFWPPYWKNYELLISSYRGECISKIEVLSKYYYSLCFENMPMAGYITEKIFDCFYAGTVPIYLGATDIEKYIPNDCFIDMRAFESATKMYEFVATIPLERWRVMRAAGRSFLRSAAGAEYTQSLQNSILKNINQS